MNKFFFKVQPSRFTNEDSRVAFIFSLLSGTALSWAGSLIRSKSRIVNTTESLMNESISVFDHNITGQNATTRLMNFKQGKRSVAEFSILFRSLASETGWDDIPLMTVFIHALSEPVRDALATLDPPSSLDALVKTAVRIDNRVREREREKQIDLVKGNVNQSVTPLSKSFSAPVHLLDAPSQSEPMQVDGAVVRSVRVPKKTSYYLFLLP